MTNHFVVVDWRPYDVPEVFGLFFSIKDAEQWARKFFEVDTDDIELPDGIIVRQLNEYKDV